MGEERGKKKKMQYSIERIEFEQQHEKRERGKKNPKQQVNNSNSSELNALIEEWIIILAQVGTSRVGISLERDTQERILKTNRAFI